MIERVRIEVASVPDYDDLVGEIWFDDLQFAELRITDRRLQITLFPHPDLGEWKLPWRDVVDVVDRAKARLAEVTGAVIE